MKYIVFKELGEEKAIIFPSSLQHREVATKLISRNTIVSAGFINNRSLDEDVQCFGDSYTLNIESRPQDSQLINDLLKRDF
jgi:hypothetical protein